MRIIPLSEGQFTIDQTKRFIPFDPQSDELQQRPTGSLLVEIQPFLLITSKDVVLLDTGLGFGGKDGQLQIHRHLRQHGIEPEMVTKVILSHLHKDHAGGISSVDVHTQNPALNFP
ncbi:MAG: MBL fold metallo-hydrolase, partial [Ferruginibacter sp.]